MRLRIILSDMQDLCVRLWMPGKKTRLTRDFIFFDGNEMEVLKEQSAVGTDEIISIVNQSERVSGYFRDGKAGISGV